MKFKKYRRFYGVAIGWLLICPFKSHAKEPVDQKPLKGYVTVRMRVFTDADAVFRCSDTAALFLGSRLTTFVRSEHPSIEFKAVRDKDSIYSFSIPVNDNWGTLSLFSVTPHNEQGYQDYKYKSLTMPIFWEPGDELNITVYQRNTIRSSYEVQGKGANKNIVAKKVARVLEQPTLDKVTFENAKGAIQARTDLAKKVLDSNRTKLSAAAYTILLVELLYSSSNKPYLDFILSLDAKLKETKDREGLAKLRRLYYSVMSFRNIQISPQYLVHSPAYRISVMTQQPNGSIRNELRLRNGDAPIDSVYYQVKKNYKGELRDVLIADYFRPDRPVPKNITGIYKDALQVVKTSYCLSYLKEFRKLPGQKITDASFYGIDGRPVSISGLNGKVVLIDVWYEGCGPCARFYKEALSKLEEKYQGDSSFVVLSIFYGTKEEWERGLKKGIYTSPGALNVTVGKDYENHSFFSYYTIISAPTIILLDKQQTIVKFNNEELRNYDYLVNVIETLK